MADVVELGLAPLTAATYEPLIRLYLVPGPGSTRVDRLSARHMQLWLNRVRDECQCCAQGKDARRPAPRCCARGRCCQQTPSPRTIRDLRGVLRSALSQAMRDELVARNVAALVIVPKVRPHRVVAWSTEEARRFLESARADRDSLCAAYVLIVCLGLRKGEVLGLTWPAVDLDQGELTVRLQLQRVRRELLLRETKTEASESALPMPALVRAALLLRADEQDRDRRAAAEAWQGEGAGRGLVFTARYGTPVDPRTLNRRFAQRCEQAAVRPLGVHDARKTCATLLVDLDGDLRGREFDGYPRSPPPARESLA